MNEISSIREELHASLAALIPPVDLGMDGIVVIFPGLPHQTVEHFLAVGFPRWDMLRLCVDSDGTVVACMRPLRTKT